jgi:hypothetical protein
MYSKYVLNYILYTQPNRHFKSEGKIVIVQLKNKTIPELGFQKTEAGFFF